MAPTLQIDDRVQGTRVTRTDWGTDGRIEGDPWAGDLPWGFEIEIDAGVAAVASVDDEAPMATWPDGFIWLEPS